ncbi:heavy-metal-associated domain-containing protein [Reyranella sp. CPCC 100927]|uniref:heavy-metal-associated domain-containing protein n=1 Tax=Reyranella sp. CPCC 100927 TaxID=2599616 RepID=UPI0011B7B0B3|nr:heavy-metal-associated domain-containing protein [Reyranella sp. CPCC 100927]TWT11629.1 heavy-metal-associated domain-containing protein [Reyranella sp. CPCC 100927]
MLRYTVPSMSCGHCAAAIERAVKGIDPQASVSVDVRAKEVSIRSNVEPARLADAIRGAGYEPQPAA